MMSKKNMFVKAHKIARSILKVVEDYAVAFQIALKYVWKAVKEWGKKRFTDYDLDYAYRYLTTSKEEKAYVHSVCGVPNWLIEENLSREEIYVVENTCCSISLTKESAKAKDICFDTDFGKIWMWAPKSVLVKDSEAALL